MTRQTEHTVLHCISILLMDNSTPTMRTIKWYNSFKTRPVT